MRPYDYLVLSSASMYRLAAHRAKLWSATASTGCQGWTPMARVLLVEGDRVGVG